MGTKIVVGSQVITIPAQGADPAWAQGIISALTAIATQLQGIASTFDIPPSVQVLTSDANTDLNVTNVVFPSDLVRSFSFNYAIYRTNDTIALAENGTVNGVYNTLDAMWELEHEFQGKRKVDGTPYTSFTMSGDQLQVSTLAIGGAYNDTESRLSYAAKTILVQDL
jgi:hypothetical protein